MNWVHRRPDRPRNSWARSPRGIFGASLAQWYLGDVGVAPNGADALAWADQGQLNLDLTQATASKQPAIGANGLGGHGYLRFVRADATQLGVASGAPPQTSDHAIFAVAVFSDPNPGAYTGLCGIGDLNRSSSIGSNNSGLAWYGGAELVNPTGVPLVATTAYRIGKVVSGANTQGYINGAVDGSAASNTYGADRSFVAGAYDSGGTGPISADIYEVVVVDVAPNAGQIADLDRYFRERYSQ